MYREEKKLKVLEATLQSCFIDFNVNRKEGSSFSRFVNIYQGDSVVSETGSGVKLETLIRAPGDTSDQFEAEWRKNKWIEIKKKILRQINTDNRKGDSRRTKSRIAINEERKK